MGSFEHVQIRIQKFLGIIGGQSHLLVPDIDLLQVFGVGGLAWDTVNQLKFTVPFRDTKPDIWLGMIMIHIYYLIFYCNCQLLHLIIVFLFPWIISNSCVA